MALSPQIQETDRCLNAVARIKPALAPDATQALKEILWDLSRRRIRPDYGSRLTQVFKDPAGIVRNVYRHLRNKPKHYNIDALYVEVRTEQAPNPNSRVALADSTDALGLRKARLHWELTELEKRTMQVTATRFGRELTRIGHGEYSMDSCLQNKDLTFPPEMVGGHHHMGTTRMAEDPKKGVIDKNCRAHGIDNLFIAGSSVFPTASFVNPTLTIVALTLRLTDYLRTLLR